MIGEVQNWIGKAAGVFMTGDGTELALMIAPRLPIYLEKDLITAASHEEVNGILREVRRHYLERGFTEMRGEIVSTEVTGNGRFKVAVDWHLTSAEGDEAKRDGMVFFFATRKPTSDNPYCLRVELVEYRKESFPGRAFASQLPHFVSDYVAASDGNS